MDDNKLFSSNIYILELPKYSCVKCNIKKNSTNFFHCDKCNNCFVGNRKNYIHCDNCKLCININKYKNHKCLSDGNLKCAICLESIHNSKYDSTILKCSHIIHNKCLKEMINHNILNCPLCRAII